MTSPFYHAPLRERKVTTSITVAGVIPLTFTEKEQGQITELKQRIGKLGAITVNKKQSKSMLVVLLTVRDDALHISPLIYDSDFI